jgi:hypothetical protein
MRRENLMTGWKAKAFLSLAIAAASFSPCWAQYPAPPPPSPPAVRQHQGQGHAGDWLRRYGNLPPAEQERALQNDAVFRRLPPDRQQILRQRLRHFSSLPPEQQQRMLKRMEIWEHLTPWQKEQARQVHDEMQSLPQERRRMVVAAMRDLSYMRPEQRLGIIDSDRFKGMFSPREREIMRQAARLPLVPPERRDGERSTPEE